MTRIKTIGKIQDTDVLWRYMSLDKLISLLESKTLYFAPLDSYKDSDPFEGYLPDVAAKAYTEIYGPLVKEIKYFIEQFGSDCNLNQESLKEARDKLVEMPLLMEKSYEKLVKEITVNCWHQNMHESEAMWRLYSDENKGVAIKTTVSSLVASFQEYDKSIQIGRVKYLDFNDDTLTPKDCSVEGYRAPLLKRASFAHENEVRCFIHAKSFTGCKNIKIDASADFVPVCTKTLIEQIYISPFAKEPFNSSVRAICGKYDFSEKVIQSSLLDSSSFLKKLSAW